MRVLQRFSEMLSEPGRPPLRLINYFSPLIISSSILFIRWIAFCTTIHR